MFSRDKDIRDKMVFAPWKEEDAHNRYISHILYLFSELQEQAMERPIEQHEYEDELSYLLEQSDWKTTLLAKKFTEAFTEPTPHIRWETMDSALKGLKKQFSCSS